jgi:transposase InsO family protein
MQRLNIDTIGPLSLDEEGHKYIVVIIDTFTRYVTLCPAKSLEAKESARIIYKHFCRFGVPDEIQTDNGTQFVNKDLDEHFPYSSHSLFTSGERDSRASQQRGESTSAKHSIR